MEYELLLLYIVASHSAYRATPLCPLLHRPGIPTLGYMLTTLGDKNSLANTTIKQEDYKWFFPIYPAPKESIHEVAPASTAGSN